MNKLPCTEHLCWICFFFFPVVAVHNAFAGKENHNGANECLIEASILLQYKF